MTHQPSAKPPHEADHAGWIAALLAQCRGHVIPPEFTTALHARLARVPFGDLLLGLDSLAANPDRRLVVQMYSAWIAACVDSAQPRFAAWFNLGTEMVRAGDVEAGMNAYHNALALKPDFHPAAANLGLQLEARGDRAGALQVWNSALQSNEARTTLLNQKARLLEQSGQFADAAQALTASLTTDPAQPDVIQHWLHIRQKMCLWPVLTPPTGLTEADLMQDCGPLASLALTDDVATQTAIAARWLERKTVPAPARLAPAEGYDHSRVRIGYLSSDFGRHAMGYLIAELFERHDRARFTIYGYCIGHEDGSELRNRIVNAFDQFTTLSGIADEQAARIIAADEIDILVDLNGLTAGARPQILRWRPAVIQATYLGFIGPVPLPELDYLFCDDYVIPAEHAAAYRPAPLAIAGLYQANDRHRVIGSAGTREAIGLPEDAFVFCCFANHYKVTQAMFAAWMTILERVPGAVLWLAEDNEWSTANLRQHAAARGIDPERLVITKRVDPADYIARMQLADLFLDTFPYNAGTIASDALRMGLPLVTLRGDSFVARMAARMLTAIGATDGITTTIDEYIACAVGLATDRARHTVYRLRFTQEAWEASIGDSVGFTAEYEESLLRLMEHAPKDEPGAG
jgi:predicted O-linked N-acetylglucosamine transferase (SPINDLY family)